MNAMPTVPELLAELERVRQNEARYRLLLEHSGEVGWIADCASGRLTYLSPAAGRLFGHDLDSAQPLAQALLRDLPARLARYRAGDASRRSVLRESELPQRDGRLIAVEIESTLISDADGTPATLLGVVRDISARREHAAQQKKFASMVSPQPAQRPRLHRTDVLALAPATRLVDHHHRNHGDPGRRVLGFH